MKRFRRCFSLLLCLALLFVGSSVHANAAEIEHQPHHSYSRLMVGNTQVAALNLDPTDGTLQFKNGTKTFTKLPSNILRWNTTFSNNGNDPLYHKNNAVRGTARMMYCEVYLEGVATWTIYFQNVDSYITYADGSVEYIEATLTEDPDGYYSVDFNFTPKADVYQLTVSLYEELPSNAMAGEVLLEYDFGEVDTDNQWCYLDSDVQTEEAGLLSGIWQSIKELPNKIGEAIKGLFIPDEQAMLDYADRMKELLASKLGAVYEVIDITFGSWEDIQLADQTDTITVPSVSIPLPDNQQFTFGGMDVQIVPTGFEFIVTILKGFIGGVCTLMFINGLRNRYDEVMGVES